jgi:N-methylhydantoinase B
MTVTEKTRLDPVTLEVLRSALPAIADEMSVDLQRTSYNMMIYEVRDYCCAVLDVEGRLLAQNIGGVSHFVADLGVVIKDCVKRYGVDGFAPGDVVITNHQRVAGQHLNNVCILTPFFFENKLTAFTIVRAHWVDVGGNSTGFGAGTSIIDPWQEGLQFDQIKIYEGGKPDEKMLRMISDNIRFPESSMGDLRSQMAACTLAERRLEELYTRYGGETIGIAIERIFDDAERKCRLIVEQIPDGTYHAESFLDDDGVETGKRVPIVVDVIVKGSDLTIDFTKGSMQTRGAINGRTLAGAYIAYKGLTGALEPVNEGSFRALKVEIQEGNLMMAVFPAPMSSWSRMLPTVVDTILTSLADAMPDRIPAATMGTLGGALAFFGRDPVKNRNFVLQTIEGGGWGARPWEDGESASVSVCQGDVRNAPVETIELKTPVIVRKRSLREGSGGAGAFRGGLGITTTIESLAEGRWSSSQQGRTMFPPWGIHGGGSGLVGEAYIKAAGDADFHREDPFRKLLAPGSSVTIMTAGGGGWGNALDRDPLLVRMDVIEEYISRDDALKVYCVVIDATTNEVDETATTALRAQRRGGGK